MRNIPLPNYKHLYIPLWVGFIATVLPALFLLAPHSARAAENAGNLSASEGEASYQVERVRISYQRQHPDNPPLAELVAVKFELGVTGQGFVAPAEGIERRSMSLAAIGDSAEVRFSAGAIQHITTSLLAHLNSTGLAGIWVGVHPRDVDPRTGEDLRAGKRGDLRILIQTAVVAKVRTLARGNHVDEGESVNNPLHQWMLEGSPVQPGDAWTDSGLLNRNELNDWARFLSRHPGRRVDLSISALGDQPGSVAVDYIVFEERPRSIWAQLSNTGTEQTAVWRATFGFQDTQLTGKDDKLDLVYSGAGFDRSHYVGASYEFPFMSNRHTRVRLNGSWNKYTASDVGFGDLDFKGKSYSVGASAVHNLRQQGAFFVDFVYGVSIENSNVNNQVIGRKGQAVFLFPHIGLELERRSRFGNTVGGLNIRWNLLNIEEDDLDALGRTEAEDNFAVLSGFMTHNFYLDRALGGEGEASTLAHEVVMSLSGQTSFRKRLPPNYQKTIGGLYSVRGYPESIISGDTVGVASFEYRFHLSQANGLSNETGVGPVFRESFRYKPQFPYGMADWDLALKGFADFGWAGAADPLAFEYDETLVGAGVGIDFRYRRNIFITVDWGFALKDTNYEAVTSGSSQVGISASILY
jgi:hemolysin activation/secretion protein